MAAGFPTVLPLSQVSCLPRCEVYFYWFSSEVALSCNEVVILRAAFEKILSHHMVFFVVLTFCLFWLLL